MRAYCAALALCAVAPLPAARAADAATAPPQILACVPKEKQAVAPGDGLQCQQATQRFDATLVELYGQGWRLIEVAFFNGDRQVLYLEK